MEYSIDVQRRNLTLKQSQVRAKNNELEWLTKDIEEKTRKADILRSSIDVLETKLKKEEDYADELSQQVKAKNAALYSVTKYGHFDGKKDEDKLAK